MKIPVKVKIDGVKKLDKYEYNLKLEEIDKLVDQGDYEEAANLADTIEWKRVRNVRTLCLISEIYEAAGRLPDSKRLLYIFSAVEPEHQIIAGCQTLLHLSGLPVQLCELICPAFRILLSKIFLQNGNQLLNRAASATIQLIF